MFKEMSAFKIILKQFAIQDSAAKTIIVLWSYLNLFHFVREKASILAT